MTNKNPYNLPDYAMSLYNDAQNNLDTDAGYRAYYELEKFIEANNLDDEVLFDLAADFRWDGSLNDAVERLISEENKSL